MTCANTHQLVKLTRKQALPRWCTETRKKSQLANTKVTLDASAMYLCILREDFALAHAQLSELDVCLRLKKNRGVSTFDGKKFRVSFYCIIEAGNKYFGFEG